MRFHFKDFITIHALEDEQFWKYCFRDVFGVSDETGHFLMLFQQELTSYILKNQENPDAYIDLDDWPRYSEEREAVRMVAAEFLENNVLFQDRVIREIGPGGLMMIPWRFWSPCIKEKYRYLTDLGDVGVV